MFSVQHRPFREEKINLVRCFLDVMADHCYDSPKNEQSGQGEQDNDPYSIPALFSFLPDLSALQLVLAGLMLLCYGLLYRCCPAGLH